MQKMNETSLKMNTLPSRQKIYGSEATLSATYASLGDTPAGMPAGPAEAMV
jgi:hypothetical protein